MNAIARCLCFAAPLGVVTAVACLDGAPLERQAHADDTTTAGSSCSLKGNVPVPKGTAIYDAATGGHVVATFTGSFVPVELSSLPADPVANRTRLATSLGSGAFRLDGYVSAPSFATYTARDIPIYGGHVWISSAQKVRITKAVGTGQLMAELTVLGSANQVVKATAPCDGFSLTRGTPTAVDVPGNGRLYASKNANVDLYDGPNGNAVFTVRMIDGTSQLFWGTETRGGFVHVISRADLTIDAWTPASGLDALKQGEMIDQAAPSTSQITGAQLAFEKQPTLVKATRDLPIRFKREDKLKPIGVIEAGAEMYVMETMTGWTNLLPKHLGFLPAEDGGFWVPTSDVPKP